MHHWSQALICYHTIPYINAHMHAPLDVTREAVRKWAVPLAQPGLPLRQDARAMSRKSQRDKTMIESFTKAKCPRAVAPGALNFRQHFSVDSFVSISSSREDLSCLPKGSPAGARKPSQSASNRLTHVVSPRKFGGPVEPARVSNGTKTLQNGLKPISKVSLLRLAATGSMRPNRNFPAPVGFIEYRPALARIGPLV
jgi:hypothetical protein